jgi:hypothetical protein
MMALSNPPISSFSNLNEMKKESLMQRIPAKISL